jgi:outer membrane lipopolysaccharide assembly protein LptE/RlpB
MREKALFCARISLFFALFTTGCGYHTVGSAAHLPPDVRTIAVKFIENKTQRYQSEVDITQAIVTELQTRTRSRIVPVSEQADADATLSGVILDETVAPYTYNSNTGQTSTYLITVTANITLTDRNNRVLYQHEDYQFHQQYEATADLASFIQEDSPAEKRLARDFAQTLVGDILESF